MAHIRKDKVAETSASTGTGNLVVGGAITGYRTFGSQMSIGDTCEVSVTAVDSDGIPTGAWETGVYTYSATNTLTRTVTTDSSNAGAAVNFAGGTKRVAMAVIAKTIDDFSPVVAISQTDYDALGTPDPDTVYMIPE